MYLPTYKQLLKVFTLPTNKPLLKVFTYKQATTKGYFTYKQATTKGIYLQTSNY